MHERTVRNLVAAINDRNVDAILEVATEDHRFVDSLGASVHGHEVLRQAWSGYFQIVPDYHIEAVEYFVAGDVVVLVGTASGTYAPDGTLTPENRWSVPAAWRATVRDGRVSEWQVFADNEPIRALIRAAPAMPSGDL